MMEENLQGTLEIEVVQQSKHGRNTENLKGKEMYWQVCTVGKFTGSCNRVLEGAYMCVK